MTDHQALIRRVRARAAQESAHLPLCADAGAVAEAERLLGFALPPLLARLYREVANGGFGPEYKLFPLVGEGRTAVSEYGTEGREPSHWPLGVLPIMDWGCAMYAAVDCLRPEAPVLLFEPNAVEDNWPDAWFQDAPSLADWLDNWLNGKGWWEEEVMLADDAEGLAPWPEAAARIAAQG